MRRLVLEILLALAISAAGCGVVIAVDEYCTHPSCTCDGGAP